VGNGVPYFEISSKWKSTVFVVDGLFQGDEVPAVVLGGGGRCCEDERSVGTAIRPSGTWYTIFGPWSLSKTA